MKKLLFVFLIIFIPLIFTCCGSKAAQKVEYENLGNYVNDNIWDIASYEGKLFFGAGDGNLNTGPTKIWSFDLANGDFSESGVLDEEVINRFVVIDNKLVAPGIDPTDKGDNVNYNYYENGEWKKYDDISPTDHLFDAVKYNDLYFYGVDGRIGTSPVFVQSQHNSIIEYVHFYKNGEKVLMSEPFIRTFDLVVFKDELYAWLTLQDNLRTLSRDVYKYNRENCSFEYFSSAFDSVIFRNYINFQMIGSKVVTDELVYIATPEGYFSRDMQSFERINLDNNIICDYWQDGDTLYALCSKIVQGKVRTSVWSTEINNPYGFTEQFYFDSYYGCISFAKDGNDFYFGTSDNMNNGEKGVVLKVTI